MRNPRWRSLRHQYRLHPNRRAHEHRSRRLLPSQPRARPIRVARNERPGHNLERRQHLPRKRHRIRRPSLLPQHTAHGHRAPLHHQPRQRGPRGHHRTHCGDGARPQQRRAAALAHAQPALRSDRGTRRQLARQRQHARLAELLPRRHRPAGAAPSTGDRAQSLRRIRRYRTNRQRANPRCFAAAHAHAGSGLADPASRARKARCG